MLSFCILKQYSLSISLKAPKTEDIHEFFTIMNERFRLYVDTVEDFKTFYRS